MRKKKEQPIDLNNIEPEEKLKYEIAEELGLLDRVAEHGWKSLTSKEIFTFYSIFGKIIA